MSSMDWEAPIQVWIESLDINEEEMHETNQRLSVFGAPLTPTPAKTRMFAPGSASPTDHTTFHCEMDEASISGERDSICVKCGTEDITSIVEYAAIESAALIDAPITSPVKGATQTDASSISPVKSKQTAKPRPARTKVNVDPIGRDQRRKSKQRKYEKTYRSRKKQVRAQEEQEFIQLEMCMRRILSRRTSVVVSAPCEQQDKSKVSIRQRYNELLLEERALREAEAFDSCFISWYQALDFWGGETANTREVRAQLNALPALPTCHIFTFTW